MGDNVSRGVPEQEKQENQDPAVAFNIDQMTGQKTDYEGNPIEEKSKDESGDKSSPRARGARSSRKQTGQTAASAQEDKGVGGGDAEGDRKSRP